MFLRVALPAVLLWSAPALAGSLKIAGASASSTYTESGNYEASRSVDGKQGTAWVEGDTGSGLGAYVELDLGSEQLVKQVRIWGGDWSSWDAWNRANRPKEIELKFSDGSTQMVTLTDEKVAQTFDIDGGGKKTSTVRVKIKAAFSGTTWPDTGISEIQLLGDADSGSYGGKATASSVAPEDGDGNYVADNAFDGLFDSMWCEGDKKAMAPGSGCRRLRQDRSVSKLTLLNGIGSSMSLWMKANQATSLKLHFSNGTSTRLPSSARASVPPATTSRPSTRAR